MTARRAPLLSFESIRVDKASAIPAYLQIAAAFKQLLERRAFPAGHPLPPERVLCESIGVSRMTLRQAMSILDQEGLIVSHRGRGTFVAHIRLRKQQQELHSFSEEVRARGGKPESRLVSFQMLDPTLEQREFFGLPDGAQVYEVCRIRLSSGVPLALERGVLPQNLCPGLEQFNLAKESLYHVLEGTYGLTLGTCAEEISARIPTPVERKLLETPKDGAVLVIDRKTYTESGVALEMTRTTYRGDLYSAVVHSARPKK